MGNHVSVLIHRNINVPFIGIHSLGTIPSLKLLLKLAMRVIVALVSKILSFESSVIE